MNANYTICYLSVQAWGITFGPKEDSKNTARAVNKQGQLWKTPCTEWQSNCSGVWRRLVFPSCLVFAIQLTFKVNKALVRWDGRREMASKQGNGILATLGRWWWYAVSSWRGSIIAVKVTTPAIHSTTFALDVRKQLLCRAYLTASGTTLSKLTSNFYTY